MSEFILEIGSEEIPARFLHNLELDLSNRFAQAFMEAGYAGQEIEVMSTPRRAVLMVRNLAAVQPAQTETVTGPPLKIAFDADNNPTKAGLGFAKTLGLEMDDLFKQETDKGWYLAGIKKTGLVPTPEFLAALCPKIITDLPFPKKMHWGSGLFLFARPLHWIVALFDGQVVKFEIAGLESDNQTFGHRVHGPGPFAVKNSADYFKIMEQSGVVVQAEARHAKIVDEGNAIAQKLGGEVIWVDSLLSEVQGLVEHPVPILGDIEADFLELPRQVLLTSMQSHQKSFGLEKDGKLLPHFLTVLNITPKDMGVVKTGWERVLRARLEDARFFWKSDLASSFEHWNQSLDKVIFLAPLGSMGEKTRRIAALSEWLVGALGVKQVTAEEARLAGSLCKADLVSGMVGEFDTLQGIMGGIYARKFGHSEVISQAIAQHYLPAGPDSPVPSTVLGAIVAMADKADTLVGCFGLNMIPSGTQDPYALRRQALGIARIMLEYGFSFDLKTLFAKAQSLYGERKWKLAPEEAITRLQDFFLARIKNYFSQSYDTLLVEAVLNTDSGKLWSVGLRLQALLELSKSPDFPLLVQTCKRVTNIIQKQTTDLTGNWNAALLKEPAEKAFADKLELLCVDFETQWVTDNYAELFKMLIKLMPAINTFFDGVMVMDEDLAVRTNRLNLLKSLSLRLERLADFSSLQM